MNEHTKKRLAPTALALATLVTALLVTCVAEYVVLAHVVDSQIKAEEASGISAPNEGFTGPHLDLLVWFAGVAVVAFPVAFTVLAFLAFWIWRKWFPPSDQP